MCQVKRWVYIFEHWYFLYLSPLDISIVSTDIPECPSPEKPVNGYLLPKYGPNGRLISVNYTCEPPFTLIGSRQRMCLPNAKWSGAVPTCVEGIFSPLGHYFLVFAKKDPPCIYWGSLFSSSIQTKTGQTSRVHCSPPAKLLNGYHKPASARAAGAQTVEFFCNKPYILSGNHQTTCLSNGSWSSRPPKCVRGRCWDWKQIMVGTMLLSNRIFWQKGFET